MSNSTETRLQAEYRDVQGLAAASGGHIEILNVEPNLRRYDLALHVRAPVGASEPYTVSDDHVVTLLLPANFPDEPPMVRLNHPIFVPNVFPEGTACIVQMNWYAQQHLDQVICDLLDEIQGVEPNLKSPANSEAADAWERPGFVQQLRGQLGHPFRMAPPQTVSPASAPVSSPSNRSSIVSREVAGTAPQAATTAPAREGIRSRDFGAPAPPVRPTPLGGQTLQPVGRAVAPISSRPA